MTNKLIRDYEVTDHSSLEDLLLVMAKNVEDSMLQAGAKPGDDYTILDLYKLAQPFALDVFKKMIMLPLRSLGLPIKTINIKFKILKGG